MKTGDVLGDDGPEPLSELFDHLLQDGEQLTQLHNPDYFANKYTEDSVHMMKQDGETVIYRGREGKILFELLLIFGSTTLNDL